MGFPMVGHERATQVAGGGRCLPLYVGVMCVHACVCTYVCDFPSLRPKPRRLDAQRRLRRIRHRGRRRRSGRSLDGSMPSGAYADPVTSAGGTASGRRPLGRATWTTRQSHARMLEGQSNRMLPAKGLWCIAASPAGVVSEAGPRPDVPLWDRWEEGDAPEEWS